MALFALSVALWVLFSAFVAYKSHSDSREVINKLIYFFGIFLVTSLLHLVCVFPYPFRILDVFHKVMLYVPAVIFSYIALTTDTIVSGFYASEAFAGLVVKGPVYNLYNSYLFLLYILSVSLLSYRIQKFDGVHLRYAKYLLSGIVVGGLPAVIIDLILPMVAPRILPNYLWGNLFTSVWLGVTLYAVRRRA